MTNSSEVGAPGPADWRRAAALIAHRAAANDRDLHDGMTAVLEEAKSVGRFTGLLRTVDAGYRNWLTELRTDSSREMVDEFIEGLADSASDRYTRLAAIAIGAMKGDMTAADVERINSVIEEANADNAAGRLTGAVCDIYHHMLPELGTTKGREALGRWVLSIAQHDDGNG